MDEPSSRDALYKMPQMAWGFLTYYQQVFKGPILYILIQVLYHSWAGKMRGQWQINSEREIFGDSKEFSVKGSYNSSYQNIMK